MLFSVALDFANNNIPAWIYQTNNNISLWKNEMCLSLGAFSVIDYITLKITWLASTQMSKIDMYILTESISKIA